MLFRGKFHDDDWMRENKPSAIKTGCFLLLYYSASMSLCLALREGFLTVTSNSFVEYESGYDLSIYSAIAAPTDDAPKTIKNKGMWIILTSYIIADYISPA